MAKFNISYSAIVTEFYNIEIEADSEQEAKLKFFTMNEDSLNDFSYYEESVLLGLQIGQILKIENETN